MAWNTGQGLSGAASGAMLGASLAAPTGGMSIPVGAILGALGGTGMGFLGGGETKGGGTGYDVVTLPQYSFTEPRLRLTSDYLSQNLERMGRGEFPVWWDKMSPTIQRGLQRSAYQTAYGKPGQRTGTVQAGMEAGALTGIGPRAANMQAQKAVSEYADKMSAIDEYMAGLGVDIMREGEGRYLASSIQMPKGPDATVVGPYGVAGTTTPDYAGQLAGIAGSIFGNTTFPTAGAKTGATTGITDTSPYKGMNWQQYQEASKAFTPSMNSQINAWTSNPANLAASQAAYQASQMRSPAQNTGAWLQQNVAPVISNVVNNPYARAAYYATPAGQTQAIADAMKWFFTPQQQR